MRIARTPAGTVHGTVCRPGSPSALDTRRGTIGAGTGKSRIRTERTAHSPVPGPVTRSNAIALMRAVGLDVQE